MFGKKRHFFKGNDFLKKKVRMIGKKTDNLIDK